MKKLQYPVLYYSAYLLLFVLLFSACRSSKDLTYLQDLSGQQQVQVDPPANPNYKIKYKDNLYVSIISSNHELNAVYNPAKSGSVGNMNSQLYEGQVGQSLYGYRVESDGNIILPFIGKVNVLDKTISEAEECIQATAGELFKEVTAKVRLLNFKVTVMGEVMAPGVYYNYDSEFTVLDAISMAKGVSNYAQLDVVKVLRTTASGKHTYELNLNSQNSLSSDAYFLQPNDVVFVQPSKYKTFQLRAPVYAIFLSSVSTFLLLLRFFE